MGANNANRIIWVKRVRFLGCVSRKKSSAFTFIEVLIVVSVFAVLILALYGILYGGLSVCKRIKEVSFAEGKVVIALERLARDLRQVYECEEEELKFSGTSNEIHFVAFGNNTNGLIQSSYMFDKDKNKLMVVYENISDVLDGRDKKIIREIASLKDFKLSYLGFDGVLNEVSVGASWEEDALPLAVKVEATIASPKRRRAKSGYVYVASGDKRETLEYEREVAFEQETKVIIRRIFLPPAMRRNNL